MEIFNNLNKYAKIAVVVFAAVYYCLILALPERAALVIDVLNPVGDVMALGLIAWGIKIQNAGMRKSWIIFALSLLSFLIGDLLYSYSEAVMGAAPDFPGVSDVFYSISFCLCFWAAASYFNRGHIYSRIRSYFDVIITILVAAILSWVFVASSIYYDSSLDTFGRLLALLYPVGDLGLLAFALILYFSDDSSQEIQAVNRMLIGAFLLWFLADQIYFVMMYLDNDRGQILAMPLWTVGHGVLGLAALRSAMVTSCKPAGLDAEEIKAEAANFSYWARLIIPYISFGILIIIVSSEYWSYEPLLAGIAVTAFLIIVRQVFTIIEKRRLMELLAESNQALKESKAELEVQNLVLQALHDEKALEARTDYLTGLPNRRHVDEKLKVLRQESDMGRKELFILMMDVDEFKLINDRWGHDAGDIVLQQIAALIKSNIRAMDIAGRLGGDEFIVILPGADMDLAQTIGDRLRARIAAEKFEYGGDHQFLSVSIGGTRLAGSKTLDDLHDMRIKADSALYKAKRNGGNQAIII